MYKILKKVCNVHNSYGEIFRVTTFGESHGKVIGAIIDGCPSGLKITIKDIQDEMNRRRPGTSEIVTSRFEEDSIEILSGIKDQRTTGAPIALIIKNRNFDSEPYKQIRKSPRPSHADYPALQRYGKWVDLRGGGRFSGRITASFVMAGSIAKKLLRIHNIKIAAYANSISDIVDTQTYTISDISQITDSTGMVNSQLALKAKELIQSVKLEQDSVGGTIRCIVEGVPAGLGNMLFGSLESKLSAAIFAIPGIRGIEFGLGFSATKLKGSQHNDAYSISNNKIVTKTNNSGGIVGGLTTGMPIVFTTAIKPPSTIGKLQTTIDLEKNEEIQIQFQGKHDPCIVSRIIPVIEAVTAFVLADILLGNGIYSQKIGEK
jgi:chorismate synthase